jgi:hypothetical protein
MSATCKSCRAPIVWSTTVAGKAVPLDAKVLTVAILQPDGHVEIVQGRQAHFATCPDATQHRKPRQRRHTTEAVQCAMCPVMVEHGQAGSIAIGGTLLCGRICADGFRAKRNIAEGRTSNADLE